VGVERGLQDFLSGPHFDQASARSMAKSKVHASNAPPLQPQPKVLTITAPIQGASPVDNNTEPITKDVALGTNEKKRLQTILDNIHIETGRPYSGDLWELSEYMPEWMKGECFSERTIHVLVMETNRCTDSIS
jgi:hypothetical protein